MTGQPIDTILQGDALEQLKGLPSSHVDCVVTSPPYWGQRDYGVTGQIGLETHPSEYINNLVTVFRELRRVLKPTGVFFLNMGDTFYGKLGFTEEYANKKQWHPKQPLRENLPQTNWLRPKQKLLIPERTAIALQDDGWILRNDVIWYKPNGMPESVRDRLCRKWEHVFILVKNRKYYFNLNNIRKPLSPETIARVHRSYKTSPKTYNNNFGADNHNRWAEKVKHNLAVSRVGNFSYDDPLHTKPYNCAGANPGDVWAINTHPNKQAHFAAYPPRLVKQCLKCGCPKDGLVLDPFSGSGTTLFVARKMALHYLGIELNPEYIEIAKKRLDKIPARLDGFMEPLEVCVR